MYSAFHIQFVNKLIKIKQNEKFRQYGDQNYVGNKKHMGTYIINRVIKNKYLVM